MKIREEFYNALCKALESELSLNDALILMEADNLELNLLLHVARYVRDKCFNKIITYSRKIFIPLTNICRNRCRYCGFRRSPKDRDAIFMNINEVLNLVKHAEKLKVKEVLICTGEKPETKYVEIKEKLRMMGYESFVEYVLDVCRCILEKTKIMLIHTNIGVLDLDEMRMLKPYVVSMGLMLECVSERLCLPGMPHDESPTKHPKIRLEMIRNAGTLKIPFTTGILVGIGETVEERIRSLFEIKRIHDEYGHIQEVIIQNFQPQKGTLMSTHEPPSLIDMLKTIAVARLIFKDKVSIQAPPNLERNYELYLLAGINDWGGISPITIDYINPENPWPRIRTLRNVTESCRYVLRERLPIYPKFTKMINYVHENLRDRVQLLVDDYGFVKKEFEVLE